MKSCGVFWMNLCWCIYRNNYIRSVIYYLVNGLRCSDYCMKKDFIMKKIVCVVVVFLLIFFVWVKLNVYEEVCINVMFNVLVQKKDLIFVCNGDVYNCEEVVLYLCLKLGNMCNCIDIVEQFIDKVVLLLFIIGKFYIVKISGKSDENVQFYLYVFIVEMDKML